jgi:hypothetical protein
VRIGGSPVAGDPNPSLAATLVKLERIAAGHPTVFEALGRFVAAGFAVDIVPGNHDIELICRPVQERFVELVARAGNLASADAAIRFHPWNFYEPGMLYAEHGHQYHDINSFHRLLCVDCAGNPRAGDMPFGSLYDDYLFSLLDSLDPPRRAIAPRSVIGVARRDPSLLVTRLPLHLRHAWILAWRLAAAGRRRDAAERVACRDRALPRHAGEIGLNVEALLRIDLLSEAAAGRVRRRILTFLFRDRLPRVARRVLRRPRRSGVAPRPDYLFNAAAGIHQILSGVGQDVPCYVFGHTHHATELALMDVSGTPLYLNTGAWAGVDVPAGDVRAGHGLPTFVRVSRARDGQVTANLLAWDAAAGSPTAPG